jgi:hypothetical protein
MRMSKRKCSRWGLFLTAHDLRQELRIDLLWRGIKVFQQSGAEPARLIERRAVVPIAAELFTAPLELSLKSGKRSCREDQGETQLSVRDILNQPIDNRIGAGNEWFLPKPHCQIIEDPQPAGSVRVNGNQLVHASVPFPPAVSALIWDEDLEPIIAHAISY